ncbi:heme exporter protein CcmB, partial [Vibrio parahaemolyticus]
WFDQVVVRGVSLPLVMLLRIVAHWLAFAPPLMLAAMVAGGLFGLDGAALVRVETGLLLGTPGLAALAVATGALTAGLRGAGAVAGLLLLPLAL